MVAPPKIAQGLLDSSRDLGGQIPRVLGLGLAFRGAGRLVVPPGKTVVTLRNMAAGQVFNEQALVHRVVPVHSPVVWGQPFLTGQGEAELPVILDTRVHVVPVCVVAEVLLIHKQVVVVMGVVVKVCLHENVPCQAPFGIRVEFLFPRGPM